MKYCRRICVFGLILSAILTVSGCFLSKDKGSIKPYKETDFYMDTVIDITAYGPNAEKAVKEAFDQFKRVQLLTDRFDTNSQVSKINQMAGISPVVVDRDVLKMIQDSITVAEKTNGAFDISVGPLTELWGVMHKGDFVPTQEEIDRLLPLVDYRMIQVDNEKSAVYLPKAGMMLDMGGVAKDDALNKAITALKANGIESALISAGGDIQVIGTKPDGSPWRIGVQDPRNSNGIIAKVTLSKWNIAQTSGDYQRYFIKDGVRYAHILNPKTGRQPSELASVTLVYKDTDVSSGGDIASSGLMVLGLEQGMEALKRFPGVEAIFVTVDGRVVVTPGLKDDVELTNKI